MSQDTPLDDLPPAERWDRVFRLLSRQPRRRLLCALLDEPPTAWVALPEAAMAPEYQGTREDLRVVLQHQHLPALAEANYVRWRKSPFEACRGPEFDEVGVVLDALLSHAEELPDQLVHGCRLLEGGRQLNG